MISYIIGTIAAVGENFIVLDNNGIGYRIYMPNSSLYQLSAGRPDVKVYTYMAVREDDISLFGFITKEELDMFGMLLTVSGIGPKGALGILSSIKTDQLKMAIAAGDSKLISQAKGIGAKTAQKIVIELKSAVSRELEISGGISTAAAVQGNSDASPETAEALLVLEALGFSRTEVMKAFSRINITESMTSSDITAEALKIIE